MTQPPASAPVFPRALETYPSAADQTLGAELLQRVHLEPFNGVATGIFALAILHTLAAARVAALGHRLKRRHDAATSGRDPSPHLGAELLHFLGEVEIVFGLWAVVLLASATVWFGWPAARQYVNDSVNYTEPLFVVVIMALASTRPVIGCAEAALRMLAGLGGGTASAWWVSILIVGPLLGSVITEPAAMTICALLLARQCYDLQPSARLKYATLGLLFVNISIGGSLSPFAAPPVLIVARQWQWDLTFMLTTFGWRALVAILLSTGGYFLVLRRDLRALDGRTPMPDIELPTEECSGPSLLPVPTWVTAVHLAFMGWTVFTAHYPALFLGGFLFFLGFSRATAPYQSRLELKTPLLVGLFLAGLVIHGGLQGWWIAPVLVRLPDRALFLGAAALTAVNDNALITYLATLVPDLGPALRLAVVQGALVGGGLTVIANAPNPAGLALLGRFFGGAVSPLGLVAGALPPTIVAGLVFRLL